MSQPEETQIIINWLDEISRTISEKNLEDHMALVSPKVVVYGNPSKDTINFAGWYKRRKNEFDKNSVVCVSYAGTRIKTIAQRRIIFNVNESIVGTGGRVLLMNKDVTLEREEDDCWRVVEEKIHNWKQQKMDEAMASNG
ncbi:MAG: hypothetical protein OEY00_10930 [Gammaproteobacteria bacterium]|nr:hypothetical protein [Gammaproteobacteria bacterium]